MNGISLSRSCPIHEKYESIFVWFLIEMRTHERYFRRDFIIKVLCIRSQMPEIFQNKNLSTHPTTTLHSIKNLSSHPERSMFRTIFFRVLHHSILDREMGKEKQVATKTRGKMTNNVNSKLIN